MEHHRSTPLDHRRTRIASVLIGIGLMAAVDEIVFHQLLAWHHLVDGYSGAVALASDGALHSAELLFLIAGLFMAKQLIETQRLARADFTAGLLLGAGGFQTFDGIVDHKILGLHQVRYVDTIWPYDVAWIGAGLIVFCLGLYQLRRAANMTP